MVTSPWQDSHTFLDFVHFVHREVTAEGAESAEI
jgi:hypothetical protein